MSRAEDEWDAQMKANPASGELDQILARCCYFAVC